MLGQPIIIDNRGGAAGNLGTDLVAKAAPDGYTVLFTLSSHTINPKLYDKLPFDVEKDFMPIGLAAMIPQVLVANPSRAGEQHQGADRATRRRKPGKLNFASVGTGSPGHIAGELFKLKTGIDMVHVPYKGGGPAVTDTLGGQVQLLFVSMPAALQYVKAGKLRAFAVTSDKRSVAAPDIPTIAESGVPIAWSTRGTARSCRQERRRRSSRSCRPRSSRCCDAGRQARSCWRRAPRRRRRRRPNSTRLIKDELKPSGITSYAKRRSRPNEHGTSDCITP